MIVQLLLILSIYHEGLLKENLSFSITKGCVLLCVLDTLVLVSFCVCEEQRACGVVLQIGKDILCHCAFWYHEKRLLTHKYLTEQTLIETSLSPLPLQETLGWTLFSAPLTLSLSHINIYKGVKGEKFY